MTYPEEMNEALQESVEKAKEANINLAYTLGIYFGYPECCIKAFCADTKNNNNKNLLKRSISDSGFIPCPKHYSEIKTGDIRLRDIIKNRVCSTEFNTK
jgi:hypothetical protein